MNGGAAYINPKWATGIFLPDWLVEMDLSYGAMLCYAKLARLAQKKGFANPSRAYLATLFRVSRAQISAYVKELIDTGLLEVKRTRGASHYRLPIHPNMTISQEEMDRRECDELERQWEEFDQDDVKKTDPRGKENRPQKSNKPTSDVKKTLHPYTENSDTENLDTEKLKEKSRRSSETAVTKQPIPEEAIRLANLLRDLLAEIPHHTPPTKKQTDQWAAEAEKMHRIDGHSWAEIEELLRWARRDLFWRRNILSMGKLREKWNRLQEEKHAAEEKEKRADGRTGRNHFANVKPEEDKYANFA